MQKFFCYIDETGPDTKGELFIVSVVIAAQDRDELLQVCETIEQATGKGRVKWIRAAYRQRLAYMQRVLTHPLCREKLCFAIYHDTTDYLSLTVQTIAKSIIATRETNYQATIFIDGLPRAQERLAGRELHHLGIHTRKVRGVR
jgi:hypothetical protein